MQNNKKTHQLNSSAALYVQHVTEKLARFQAILDATGFSEIVIGSGDTLMQFQDDMAYQFKANPYFKEWVPLNKRAGSFLQIAAGSSKPTLFLLCVEDIWHTAPQSLPAGFEDALNIVEYSTIAEVQQQLSSRHGGTAFINSTNSLSVAAEYWNPEAVINQIDFQRLAKTPYEQDSVREASHLAARAHVAAYDAFMAGCSELEIAAAYLRACDQSENEMPYGIIAGVNEHAAVLHHHDLFKQRQTPRSFLLDAGVDVRGYASDITRTYAYDPASEFAAMIELLDSKQLELCAAGGIGNSPVDLQILSHRKIAEVLVEFGVITTSVDSAMDIDLTATFYQHGLGHHLGCNVHDKGSRFANAKGDQLPAPEKYPKLRNLAPMVANQIHTVEPGLYFIPSLLNKLRNSEFADTVNWSRINEFLPYGGIRIEDNIIVHADGSLENLTRDAFKGLSKQ